MSKELPFVILCIEEYKKQKNLNGKEVIAIFDEYSIFDYLKEFYESLHTFGTNYIVNDIDEYIKAKQQERC